MKIKMKTMMAGPTGHADIDDIVDLPRHAAQELIDGGYAVKVESQLSPGKAKHSKDKAKGDK